MRNALPLILLFLHFAINNRTRYYKIQTKWFVHKNSTKHLFCNNDYINKGLYTEINAFSKGKLIVYTLCNDAVL
ncbi:hypothetical protein EP18_14900 [Lysinibacillus sphaericus]|nr:hypothetical protein EP18_14900 [Lysinibacillus sphaericus]